MSAQIETSLIVLLMGVAGTGKTTIGKLLAAEVGASFCDADDLHTPASIAKMRAGQPLDDGDRWPWLDRVRARIDEAVQSREALVVACSALKHSYRERLRSPESAAVQIVYLRGNKATITERVRLRQNHFMKVTLIDSQCEALEEPTSEDALILDISETPANMVSRIRSWLAETRRTPAA